MVGQWPIVPRGRSKVNVSLIARALHHSPPPRPERVVLVGGGKVGGGDAGEVEGLGEDAKGGGVVSSDAASKCAV